MNLLTTKMKQLKEQKALIPFITAGHPRPDMTVALMHELVSCGADVIELGMPFSDPMADGPVIQLASEQAIAQGVGILDVLEMVKVFRQDDENTPVVLMGYLNPVECMGYEPFAKQANVAGVNAVLLVDSPPEESAELLKYLEQNKLQQIFLVSPTTTSGRTKMICQHASGFIYYVALKGVTGSADLNTDSIQADIEIIRKYSPLPVAVGFGVKDASTATAVAKSADAVVIGSALVSLLGECDDLDTAKKAIQDFIKPIRKALDSL